MLGMKRFGVLYANCPAYNPEYCFSAKRQNPHAWMFLGALGPKYTEELLTL